MHRLRQFIHFWVDFIIGDAWEVAFGIAVALVLLEIAGRRMADTGVLGYVLLAVILLVNLPALLRGRAAKLGDDSDH